jgi:hypothetical protein
MVAGCHDGSEHVPAPLAGYKRVSTSRHSGFAAGHRGRRPRCRAGARAEQRDVRRSDHERLGLIGHPVLGHVRALARREPQPQRQYGRADRRRQRSLSWPEPVRTQRVIAGSAMGPPVMADTSCGPAMRLRATKADLAAGHRIVPHPSCTPLRQLAQAQTPPRRFVTGVRLDTDAADSFHWRSGETVPSNCLAFCCAVVMRGPGAEPGGPSRPGWLPSRRGTWPGR